MRAAVRLKVRLVRHAFMNGERTITMPARPRDADETDDSTVTRFFRWPTALVLWVLAPAWLMIPKPASPRREFRRNRINASKSELPESESDWTDAMRRLGIPKSMLPDPPRAREPWLKSIAVASAERERGR
jgi:hypothetical protein